VLPALVDTSRSEPAAATARAVAISPSGCAARWKVVGATQTGAVTSWFSRVVAVETVETSRSTLGSSRSNAACSSSGMPTP
jgi:hypothetical protein